LLCLRHCRFFIQSFEIDIPSQTSQNLLRLVFYFANNGVKIFFDHLSKAFSALKIDASGQGSGQTRRRELGRGMDPRQRSHWTNSGKEPRR
jgi:hypothetical protein